MNYRDDLDFWAPVTMEMWEHNNKLIHDSIDNFFEGQSACRVEKIFESKTFYTTKKANPQQSINKFIDKCKSNFVYDVPDNGIFECAMCGHKTLSKGAKLWMHTPEFVASGKHKAKAVIVFQIICLSCAFRLYQLQEQQQELLKRKNELEGDVDGNHGPI